MALSPEAEQVRERTNRELINLLHEAGEHLPASEQDDFASYFDRFGPAKIVMLGEATHGTSEFDRARAAITRQLIEHHGFNIVAVEADWPDAAVLDHLVRQLPSEPPKERPFERFPTWMWRNVEVKQFINYLRFHNDACAADRRVEFRGLDVYSLNSSIAAVIAYLEGIDPERARAARERYSCLTPWQADPAGYGRAVFSGRDSCEDEVVAQLRELLSHRLSHKDGGEAFFNAAQNARIVRAAEQYYRIMYRGSTESWNLRDRHMFDTLQYVMQERGPQAKAVVWAHNSHIGNAAATSMGWGGEFNIGELVRNAYGDEAVLIGFGTDRGTVAAASDWGGEMEIKSVRPACEDSYEYLFRRTGLARSLTDLRPPGRSELRDRLTGPRLERAIGVIYRPETELLSHYFEAVLPEQFDAFVWFEDTKAVTPLATRAVAGAAETYPFGF